MRDGAVLCVQARRESELLLVRLATEIRKEALKLLKIRCPTNQIRAGDDAARFHSLRANQGPPWVWTCRRSAARSTNRLLSVLTWIFHRYLSLPGFLLRAQ